MKRIVLVLFLLSLLIGSSARGDSIFDFWGNGGDVVPVSGETRALGGATAASDDPLTAGLMNPFAAAFTEKVTVTIGAAQEYTRTDNFGEKKQTASTVFPTISLTVPIYSVSAMSGIFLEKAGRLSLADSGTAYVDEAYDARYDREVSIYSVPLYVSTNLYDRVVIGGGFVFSAYDSRWKEYIDFRSDDQSDTEDIAEIAASGPSFSAGVLLNLDRVRVAGLLRGKADLTGTLERSNRHGGIWAREDVTIASKRSYNLGLWAKPVEAFSFEVDYMRSPWSNLKYNGTTLSDVTVERWSVGLKYRGDHLWEASKYPVCVGYYRQPLDWEVESTGKITEQVFSIGTSVPLGGGQAEVAMALEFGRRKASDRSDVSENTFAFTLSVSAMEAWRREVKR
jgi:hypothetical protein